MILSINESEKRTPEEFSTWKVMESKEGGETREEEKSYNPLDPVRIDFGNEWIYRKRGKGAVIDDPDYHNIQRFYRNSIKEGSLLNLGAGATHFHHMLGIAPLSLP